MSETKTIATKVEYQIDNMPIALDFNFVKSYLVRGRSELVTEQEMILFMNTCKFQKLNPLVGGEVYLIKYDKEMPAQIVVGKGTYTKRADSNPNYIRREDGIVVLRGNDVVKKEGCCIYPSEKLLGGWCKVYKEHNGREVTTYKEVSLSEYDTTKSNWKARPATMINKVAISQCLREAFPQEYNGLYEEDELIASGVLKQADNSCVVSISDTDKPTEETVSTVDNVITTEQRIKIFDYARNLFGSDGEDVIREILDELGIEKTKDIKQSQYDTILQLLDKEKMDREEALSSVDDNTEEEF